MAASVMVMDPKPPPELLPSFPCTRSDLQGAFFYLLSLFSLKKFLSHLSPHQKFFLPLLHPSPRASSELAILQTPTSESKLVDEATSETIDMETEGPNWGLINAEEISEMKIIKAIKKKICGGWVCVNCVADVGVVGVGKKMGFGGWVCMNCVAGLGVVGVGNKKWVWWLGLCELCRRRGCGKKKFIGSNV
jgi:hypothetical protein